MDEISWRTCPHSSDGNIQCGFFEVPLDWANESSGKARLAVAKYGATNSPRKGVLLSNPGPPPSVIFQRAIFTHSSHRWSWRIRRQPHHRIWPTHKRFEWWILRYYLLGSKGCWFHNVSLHPSSSPTPCLLLDPVPVRSIVSTLSRITPIFGTERWSIPVLTSSTASQTLPTSSTSTPKSMSWMQSGRTLERPA